MNPESEVRFEIESNLEASQVPNFYQRPLSEEACSVLLLVLATIEMRRGKSVTHVAQRVAALTMVQGSSSLFPSMEEELNKLLLMTVSGRNQNVKGKNVWLC